MRMIFIVSCALVLLGAGCVSAPPSVTEVPSVPVAPAEVAVLPDTPPSIIAPTAPPPKAPPFGFPLERALERVTKKPFGLYVTPKNSPVSPERFSGYHVGVDFETFADEEDREVAVSAVCEGELVLKKSSAGYGGVVVQRCQIDHEPVTVVYGHLRLESVSAKVGDLVKRGAALGVLGKGYSAETDGERKHLHLGVHRGSSLTVRGYVQTKAAMSEWLDARLYFPM